MSKVKNYSLISKLRKEKRSDPDFETKINQLSIEEIISLKLELIYKSIGDKTYGLHLWKNIDHLIKESIIKSVRDKVTLHDILSSNSKNRPIVKLIGNISKKYSFLVSVTHEREYAVAVVISYKL